MVDKQLTEVADKIIVALDLPATDALRIASDLQGLAHWMKVGMTLYYAEGPVIISQLKALGYKVFVDLKLFDIPHQVNGAAASLTALGADMLTVHALGGLEMASAARDGAASQAKAMGIAMPSIIGVTVLTSMDEQSLRQTGITAMMDNQVARLAGLVVEAGLDGVVASPQEAVMLRKQLGSQPLIVTPGIRPAPAQSDDQRRTATTTDDQRRTATTTDDQRRTATPAEALAAGANYLVIGRPITAATDPVAAFRSIISLEDVR